MEGVECAVCRGRSRCWRHTTPYHMTRKEQIQTICRTDIVLGEGIIEQDEIDENPAFKDFKAAIYTAQDAIQRCEYTIPEVLRRRLGRKNRELPSQWKSVLDPQKSGSSTDHRHGPH